MKRKTAIFAYVLILTLLLLTIPFSAEDSGYFVIDNAELLDRGERVALETYLHKLSQKMKANVIILTTDSIGDADPMTYAYNFYDDGGYGYGDTSDGVILLVSMEKRDLAMGSTGTSAEVFPGNKIDLILDEIAEELGDGHYYEAFSEFIELCDKTYEKHIEGEKFPLALYVILAFSIGFVAALISTAVMRSKLKSVRPCNDAGAYIEKGSFRLTECRDLFLYTTVTKTPRPKSNSSGDSRSSGRSGGSRKF